MTEALLFVNIGLLVIGSVTLTIAIFVLQKARGYVDLAEERLERLREGQEHLFQFLREERRSRSNEYVLEESPVPEARQGAETQGPEPKSRTGMHTERPAPNVGLIAEESPESAEVQAPEAHPTTKPLETTKTGGPRSSVQHAHPDDDVSLRRESGSVKMFQEHYYRYLENYEGYVKLAERTYKMREEGEVLPGSPAEHEWEQKLRRLNDGIQRTTARLDILEQYNPELASDDRVTHRADISRSYSELEKKLSSLENS
ncbi:MAG: hypothetical protein WA990_08560 [Rubrobacteraceae bacterium]